MKQVNNRQKMFVKPRESVEKHVVGVNRLQTTVGRKQTSGQKLVPLYGMPKGGRDRRQKTGGKRK